jgi:integrase
MNQGSLSTGQVVEKARKSGRRSFAIRFRACGERHYVTLGYQDEGWDRRRAETELQNVLADVRRGTWRPVRPEPDPEPIHDPIFHEFASEWFEQHRGSWRASTRSDYLWQLSNHLLPFFASHTLTQITVPEVDRYRQAKVAEGVLSAASINKTLTRLGQIMDQADEYGVIDRNPMRVNPRNRKLRAPKPAAVWLDRADQIEALLDAALAQDRDARRDGRHIARHAMLSVLSFGGLRLGEMLNLRWRDVDLAAGRMRVVGAPDEHGRRLTKTDAGARFVELLPPLREVLATHRAGRLDARPDELVFCTREGTPFRRENFRNRVFAPAVALADRERGEAGLSPLPERLSPHKLRHTTISLWFAAGWELPRVMKQAGHSDSGTTLRIYAHVMEADPDERDRLKALIGMTPPDFRERFVWQPGDARVMKGDPD